MACRMISNIVLSPPLKKKKALHFTEMEISKIGGGGGDLIRFDLFDGFDSKF